MIRSTLAAAAIALLAVAPAFAQEVRVSTVGKSPAELHKSIVTAARAVCWADTKSDSLSIYTYPACLQESVERAVRQTRNRDLAAYSRAHSGELRYASR